MHHAKFQLCIPAYKCILQILAFIEVKWSILRCPGGSKMHSKSIKTLIKNRHDFCHDFGTTFSRSWSDFGSKKLSKMRGLGITFSTLLRIHAKCDFEQHSKRFATFFNVGGVIFPSWKVSFSLVFSKAV